MTGSCAIFRIDAVGETEADAKTASQIVEFNGGATPDSSAHTVSNSCHWIRSVNFHGNPRRALNKAQDGKLAIKKVTISGWFQDTTNTAVPAIFDTWMKEDAANTALPWGRFGLRIDDYASSVYDLVPIATKGYILAEVQTEDPETPAGIGTFTAMLYRNGDP